MALLSKVRAELGVTGGALERCVQYFCRMTLAIVTLSCSRTGAYTCTDKIPIQSVELEKHLKLKCQVEMNMPRIRMWKQEKKRKREKKTSFCAATSHVDIFLCVVFTDCIQYHGTRDQVGVKSTASRPQKNLEAFLLWRIIMRLQ